MLDRQRFSVQVLTINILKTTAFNRRFIFCPELRDIRARTAVSADVPAGVMGAHEVHRCCMWAAIPPFHEVSRRHYVERFCLQCYDAEIYGRASRQRHAIALSINIYRESRCFGRWCGKARRALLPHCAADDRKKSDSCDVRVHLGLREGPRTVRTPSLRCSPNGCVELPDGEPGGGWFQLAAKRNHPLSAKAGWMRFLPRPRTPSAHVSGQFHSATTGQDLRQKCQRQRASRVAAADAAFCLIAALSAEFVYETQLARERQ